MMSYAGPLLQGPGASRQVELLDERALLPAGDPRGDAFCAAFSPEVRRLSGITLTPDWLVQRMLTWAEDIGPFDEVIDPGSGSGRFALEAAGRFGNARVVGIETNAELISAARAAAAERALSPRFEVIADDFRRVCLPAVSGRRLFVGNPPYVRHHDVDPAWKAWYKSGMRALGIEASALAGLHAHFLLRTQQLAREGDGFCFLLPAEWLDTTYGSALRRLFARHLPVHSMWLAPRHCTFFADALVSSVVVLGVVGRAEPQVRIGELGAGAASEERRVSRDVLAATERWSTLWSKGPAAQGRLAVGDLFEVRRGQVTGSNGLWVYPVHQPPDVPSQLLYPCITRARELLDLPTAELTSDAALKRTVDIPPDWRDRYDNMDAERIERFLNIVERAGANTGYIARHRRPWFSVRLGAPPPIVMTYMARRPPRFVLNTVGARLLNIAHGLYPRARIEAAQLPRIVEGLNRAAVGAQGRAYAGALIKFEPGDAMRMRFDLPQAEECAT